MLAAAVALAVAAAWWFLIRTLDAPLTPITQTVRADDLHVTAQLDDAALGPRAIDILVRDSAGRPANVDAVLLRFTMAEMDMGQIEAAAQPAGDGRYQARGSFFTMVGRWTVDALISRGGQPAVQARFAFPIAAPGEASGPLNPLQANASTLQAGRLLYQAHCASCHGAGGNGDGPAAVGLRPRPADFTQHMLQGQHTDGQIYLWIKDGLPGTAMAGWGRRLNDEQLWQLVTYLRTFGQQSAATAGTSAALPTAPAAPQSTGTPGRPEPLPPLIFVRQGNLWRSDGSGAPPRQLTNPASGSIAEHPALSPDGRRIAFLALAPGPVTATPPISITTLSTMNADGSDVRALWTPPRGRLSLPAWAPDGRSLYVGLFDILSEPTAPVTERLFQIMRVDPSTGSQQIVLKDARDAAFSPDGARLVYLRYEASSVSFSLYLAAADGSEGRELLAPGAFSGFAAPRFSPDGNQIVFAALGGPVTDERGNPRASGPTPLGWLLGLIEPPTAEAHGAPWDIWVINADGSGLRRLPDVREDTPMALFTPDGRQIVMMGAGGIYLLDRDGGNLRKVDPLGDHGGFDWAGPR